MICLEVPDANFGFPAISVSALQGSADGGDRAAARAPRTAEIAQWDLAAASESCRVLSRRRICASDHVSGVK